MSPRAKLGVAAVWTTLMIAGSAVAAPIRYFAYDPADDETRHAAGGLTFEFKQHLMSTELLRVRATDGPATAELKHSGVQALGPGGLTALIGAAPERDLYEVMPQEEGEAMIAALCPGARRAWMAFDRLKADQDTRVFVLADGPGGAVRLCRRFVFSFRGEWSLPKGPPLDEKLPATSNFPR